MNSDEAKFILQARRPDGSDDQYPTMREALDQAARDPLLGEWLSKQERFDASVANALRQVQPPPDLRALILAGAAAQSTKRDERAWWRRTPWLAMAASLTLIATLGTLAWVRLTPSAPSMASFSDELPANLATLRKLAFAETGGAHGKGVHADQVGDFGRWLETPGQRLTVGLPADFAGLQALGCRVLTVAGREVLEVCFKRDQVYHLYIARRSDFAPAAQGDSTSPEILIKDGMAVATWTKGDMIHVLAANGDALVLDAIL
jgi:hypothetical protein